MAAKQKILIVDDDNNIAELISLYLTKECFDTKIVNDGEEALKAFEQYSPNLILLDLMLPGIDGYQVCREVRAKANVPIIMLSAKGEIFDKVLGLELGRRLYHETVRFQGACRARQSRFAPLPACQSRRASAGIKMCEIPGSDRQLIQLLRYL